MFALIYVVVEFTHMQVVLTYSLTYLGTLNVTEQGHARDF
jgi:hypothetical protein